MANETLRDISGLASPDPAVSETNSSVQVNLDSLSNRGRSIGRRSRSPSLRPSPSRAPELSLARQATTNSLSSFLASQPASQPSSQVSQGDRPPPEDLLRDLIAATDLSSDAIRSALHGVKRPHDDEINDEPVAKRDKLGEELERMFSAQPTPLPASVAARPSSAISVPAAAAPVALPHRAQASGSGNRPVRLATQDTLPLRTPRRRPVRLPNAAVMSNGGIPDGLEPASPASGDEKEDQALGRGR